MPATGRGGRGRVGRGGVREKPCEGFAPTGPAPPNHHLISCTLRRAGTQKEQRQGIASKAAAAPSGQTKYIYAVRVPYVIQLPCPPPPMPPPRRNRSSISSSLLAGGAVRQSRPETHQYRIASMR